MIVPRHVLCGTGFTAPSDQLTKAIISVGGMGRGHISYEGTRLLAICDVDRKHLDDVLAMAGKDVTGYADYREVLQRTDVDVIHIATPPHWHCLMSVEAARAGKDIWCEKPMTRTIGKGIRVVDEVNRHRRMFRLNTWFRFKDPFYGLGTDVKPLKKVVQSGVLGWPLTVTVSGVTGYDWKFSWSGRTDLTPQPVPAELDYDMWLGPAPCKPYNPERVHAKFRGYWDYDGGGLGDMGQHYLDPVQYLLGKDNTSPARVDIDAPQQHYDAAGRLATRAAALAILADFRGPAALPELLMAVDHADRTYRNAALMSAERIPGPAPVRQWIAKAKKIDAEQRAEIIAMLGRQGDRRALAFIRASLAASEPDVMPAAAGALAPVERANAAPDLLGLLKTATGDTAGRVAGFLLWTIDERHLDPLAALLDTLQPSAKAAALGVIGARGGKRFAGRIFPLTSDGNPEIRAAAFGALAGVVGTNDLPALLRLLQSADAAATGDVQKAVVAAANEIAPEDARATPLLDAMRSSQHPERIVETLAQVGGPQALVALVEQFNGSVPAVKAAAFRGLVQWRGSEAADWLFTIYASGDTAYRDQAFVGFVRQISSSSLPADQKVLQFRMALALATASRERRLLIRGLERAKTFQAFRVAASFLDDPEAANDAAGAVMRIALPAAGARDGLGGTLVRSALERVLQVLTGPESEYEKENIRTYLAAMPKDEGLVPMFNGKDLTGWKGLVENPIARSQMSPQDLAATQAEADTKARTTWSVRDGLIVVNGTGDNLCSVKDYGDFEMLVDWRITKGGDSGIYLRGTPQLQIWDPARVYVGAQVGSGGLYNNQKNPSKPLVCADNPVGDWNTLGIKAL